MAKPSTDKQKHDVSVNALPSTSNSLKIQQIRRDGGYAG